jgi:Family of unknown function (DUF6527)
VIRHQRLQHRFVDRVPRELERGVLFISLEHGTAIHSCCCGCGEEVVTPLTPTDWRMTFDGETVSLHPSIGNWQLPCRSHYVIDRGRVVEAGPWTRKQVRAEQARDERAKAAYYTAHVGQADADAPISEPVNDARGFWVWLKRVLK